MIDNSGSLKQIDTPDHKTPLASWLFTQMQNAQHIHERWMARFLERRGWCVFYLDKQARECRSVCWLKLYEGERIKEIK